MCKIYQLIDGWLNRDVTTADILLGETVLEIIKNCWETKEQYDEGLLLLKDPGPETWCRILYLGLPRKIFEWLAVHFSHPTDDNLANESSEEE